MCNDPTNQNNSEDESFDDLELSESSEDDYFISAALEFLIANRKEYMICVSCHNPMLPGKISICPECLEQEVDSYNLIIDEE
jgi:hypothetical protein